MKKDKRQTCPDCGHDMEKVGIHNPIYICLNPKCQTKLEQLTLF